MMMLILMIKLRRKKGKGSDKARRTTKTLSFSLFLSPWLFRAFVLARTLRAFREVLREIDFRKILVCCLGFDKCEQEVF